MKFYYCIDKEGDIVFVYKGISRYRGEYFNDGWNKMGEADFLTDYRTLIDIKEIQKNSIKEMKNFLEREYPEYIL